MATDGSFGGGIAVGLLLGLLLGSVGALAFTGSPPTTSIDPANPPATVETATGCVPERNVGTGWSHQIASGESYTVTANVTVGHAADESVNGSFERVAPGEYAFRVETVSAGKAAQPTDCPTGSTAQLSASLPNDWRSVTITVDGDAVATVRNDGETTAELQTFAFGNASGS